MVPKPLLLASLSSLLIASPGAAQPDLFGERKPDGKGAVTVHGELKKWHNVILTLDGPFAHEKDNAPNPFIDRVMNVRFTHESGEPSYLVPGYFAADGKAAETSAESGTQWRAHLAPDKTGSWTYAVDFKGTPYDGIRGSFAIKASDKSGHDLRSRGRVQYVGSRYMRYADSGERFLKAGADAPETLLAYSDFDNTVTHDERRGPLKDWAPHIRDWRAGDPTWKGGKGKGLIGAVNYLADRGVNAFSFLTYNAGGDGDNVWPHLSQTDKLHFDCSKLDQWGIVFNHATSRGMYLHFKLQETENDDTRGKGKGLAHALDGGDLGIERRAYLRELIARFGHNLALNWNVGEENTQSFEQSSAMVAYIRATDPYGHNVVMHTYPNQQQKQYGPYLGRPELLTGVSIQNGDVARTHEDALRWVARSEAAGHPWIVAVDEAGNAGIGTPPDPDWPGLEAALAQIDTGKMKVPSIDEIRAEVLWGTLMAGGTGVEYYFGYRLPENDLNAQDWRSRETTWNASRIALDFFRGAQIPLEAMTNANALIGNSKNSNERYCLAAPGDAYLVYLRRADQPFTLDLSADVGEYSVAWFDPRNGGALQKGSLTAVRAGGKVDLGNAPDRPTEDWVVLLKR